MITIFSNLLLSGIRALLQPENKQEHRTAEMFILIPILAFVVGVVVAFVIGLLLPQPWETIICVLWLLYIWVEEPLMYYVEDGDRVIRYINTGRHE